MLLLHPLPGPREIQDFASEIQFGDSRLTEQAVKEELTGDLFPQPPCPQLPQSQSVSEIDTASFSRDIATQSEDLALY